MNYDQARWTRENGDAGGGGTVDSSESDGSSDDNDGGDSDVYEPLLAEKKSRETAVDSPLPDDLTRDSLSLPDPAEPELARHYTRLSQMNYGIETGPFPLGSCTMKYNPKFTEDVAALPAASVHPDRSPGSVQGTLSLTHRLQEYLERIGGMDAVTLQPPAGAAGELTGILIAKAYHEHHGRDRSEVIVTESAHGTNFASAAMAGFDVLSLPSGEDGRVDTEALRAAVSEDTAALMLTNPNTLGLFERDIEEIAGIVHEVDGVLYYDGANLNALLGRARPGDMGFDVMHYNVHKTFATPHGGGGPGAGPVGVVKDLTPYLPDPHVRRVGTDGGSTAVDSPEPSASGSRSSSPGEGKGADGTDEAETGTDYEFYTPTETIGKIHGFYGNWFVLVKTYAYLCRLGDSGLRDASAKAVLNANYLAGEIDYEVPYEPFHHEFVASADRDATEVARRMLDHGVHPPTTKWPEIVPEALMTEPTEAESKAALDQLASAFNAVASEDDATLEEAPERASARRIDQADAARNPRLSWHALDEEE
jgi:glycine dehydrogenase subunit 2